MNEYENENVGTIIAEKDINNPNIQLHNADC